MTPELFMLRVELASVLDTRMTVTNRTDENGDRIFFLSPRKNYDKRNQAPSCDRGHRPIEFYQGKGSSHDS